MSDWHVHDDFERADTAAGTIGTAPSGQAWSLTGTGAATAKITGGRFVSGTPGTSQNTYAFVTMPYAVRSSRGIVRWDSLTNPQTVTLASSKYPETGFTANLVHLLIGPTSLTLQKFVNSVATNLQTEAMALAIDTDHEFFWELSGDVVTVRYPGGSFSVRDADFLAIAGRTAFFQIFDTATSTGAARIAAVDAKCVTPVGSAYYTVLRARRGR